MIKQLTNFFFQKNIEIIAQNLYFDKIKQRENDDYQAKNFELSRFLGRFVIYIPNNSENLCVGYAKSIEKVSISKSPHLLIVDVVTKKEKIAIGKIFPYTENRFLALNKLTSKERLEIFHNYDENNQLYYHNSLMLSSSRWEEIVAESIMKFSQS